MAVPPELRRLLSEDFPDQSEWIDRLLIVINQYFEANTAALTNALTINENFAGKILTIDIDGTFPIKLAWQGPRPISVLVGNCVRVDGKPFTLTNAVQVQWSFNQNGQLQIDTVVGISPDPANKYRLTLECKSG